MPDDLYNRDILEWSRQQANLLRRLAAGERANDLDWPNLIEEVEDVGKSELRACAGLLTRAIEYLLKVRGWPNGDAVPHWRSEAIIFLGDASAAFSPSMRQRLDGLLALLPA